MSQASDDQFSTRQVRPRFKVETPFSVETLTEKIRSRLDEENAPCKGRFVHGHVTLYLPPQEQHYWSPQLDLTLEESEKGSTVRGMYGPRPIVWTMFVFFYSVIGFAALVITVLGLSYLSLGRSVAILWLVPVLVIAFFTLYLVANFGKKMGRGQMGTLHEFVKDSTGLPI